MENKLSALGSSFSGAGSAEPRLLGLRLLLCGRGGGRLLYGGGGLSGLRLGGDGKVLEDVLLDDADRVVGDGGRGGALRRGGVHLRELREEVELRLAQLAARADELSELLLRKAELLLGGGGLLL